jgi:hypothetical protein
MSFLPALITAIDEEIAVVSGADTTTVEAHGLSLSFDWSLLRFRMDGGGDPIIVSGQEALLEDIVKVLLTPRFRYAIYSPDYGADWEDLIGDPYPLVVTQIPRVVTEALMLDPRILSVSNFAVGWVPGVQDGVKISFLIRDFNGDVLHVPEVVLRYG